MPTPVVSSYLVDPRGFPEAGEPWGSESARLAIGNETFRIDGLSRSQKETVEGLWSGFPEGRSEGCPIALSRIEPEAFRNFDKRGWSYELELEYGPASTRMTGIDLLARIGWGSWGKSLDAALWVATEEPTAFHGAFENFLRVLVAHSLVLRGGALLHSAGVVDERGARLFLGTSGAGKSTLSRMAHASRRRVVSDDLNLIAPDGTLAGSPFLGDVGARTEGRHPLVAIYRLEKGARETLRPMGAAETLATLTACAPYVNRSSHLREILWSRLTPLVSRVPGHVLTFRRDGDVWRVLA